MDELFAKIDSDDRMRKLFSVAGRIFRDSILLSDLEPEERIFESLEDLDVITRLFKIWGAEVVLTMGTFDLLHVGHVRYIRKARKKGTLLIVGVEDDVKARGRKGENRPAVPYVERAELLTYLRYADAVVMKSHGQKKWEMIKTVKPHVLNAVVGTYDEKELEALREFCGEVTVIERQAETSTSAKIRRMTLDGAENFKRILSEKLPDFATEIYENMKKG